MAGKRKQFDYRTDPWTGVWDAGETLAQFRADSGQFDTTLGEDGSYVGEWHEVNSTSHWVRLREPPQEDTPSTVSCWLINFLAAACPGAGPDPGPITVENDAFFDVDDYIMIDDEQMQVDAKPGGNILTVDRNTNGTGNVAHVNGSVVYNQTKLTETAGVPGADEFRCEYDNSTAWVAFNAGGAQDGRLVRFVYKRSGTVDEAHLCNNLRHSPIVPWIWDAALSKYKPMRFGGDAGDGGIHIGANTTWSVAANPTYFGGGAGNELADVRMCWVRAHNLFIGADFWLTIQPADNRQLLIIQVQNVCCIKGTIDMDELGGFGGAAGPLPGGMGGMFGGGGGGGNAVKGGDAIYPGGLGGAAGAPGTSASTGTNLIPLFADIYHKNRLNTFGATNALGYGGKTHGGGGGGMGALGAGGRGGGAIIIEAPMIVHGAGALIRANGADGVVDGGDGGGGVILLIGNKVWGTGTTSVIPGAGAGQNGGNGSAFKFQFGEHDRE